ncbi:MAG: hypothetical protein ISS34_08270 [Candidatus Omnitrophica bacterium]|nr:hypothetical protein [Candidatus Omnitrophota bacterium]
MKEDLLKSLCRDGTHTFIAETTMRAALIRDFVNLQLQPEDLEEYRQDRKAFNLKKISRSLNEIAERYNIKQAFIDYNPVIDKNLPRLEKFYTIAHRRDKAFFKNASKVMKEEGQKRAVLIAGGFHTERLMPLFKEEGYSYAVVTPKVKDQTDYLLYRSLLRGELFHEEKKIKAGLKHLRIEAVVQRVPAFRALVSDLIGEINLVNTANTFEAMEGALPAALREALVAERARLELDMAGRRVVAREEGRFTWEYSIDRGECRRSTTQAKRTSRAV